MKSINEYKTLSSFIENKNSVENAISYDIKYSHRLSTYDAWLYAKSIGSPFNTLVSFEFEKDSSSNSIDVNRVRRVAHWCRVYIKNFGVETYQIWVRNRAVGSNVEQFSLLTHCPPDKFESFKANVTGWKFEKITVSKTDYDKSVEVNGKYYTIFDYLFRACDNSTRVRLDNILSEQSEEIVGVRSFYSLKLRSYNR